MRADELKRQRWARKTKSDSLYSHSTWEIKFPWCAGSAMNVTSLLPGVCQIVKSKDYGKIKWVHTSSCNDNPTPLQFNSHLGWCENYSVCLEEGEQMDWLPGEISTVLRFGSSFNHIAQLLNCIKFCEKCKAAKINK